MNEKKNRQLGASMIEVLVALVILSVGLLGLAMLQGKTMRVNTNAMLRSQATLMANEIIDCMRINPTGASNQLYVYNMKTQGKPAACSSCSGYTKAANDDLRSWYDAQIQVLPSPASQIVYDATTKTYTITMQWDERGVKTTQVWKVSI